MQYQNSLCKHLTTPFRLPSFMLKFCQPQLENEFSLIIKSTTITFHTVILGALLLVSATLGIAKFIANEIIYGSVFLGFFVLLSLSLLAKNKSRKIFHIITVVLGAGVLGTGLAFYNLSYDKFTLKETFYEGFVFGLLTTLLQRAFPQCQSSLFFTLGLALLRFVVVPPLNAHQAIITVLFDLANVVITYIHEKKLRNLFKTFNNYRTDLSKFKALLTYHLPENIIILSQNLDRKFFVTNSFITNFHAETLGQIKNFISNLTINMSTLDQASFYAADFAKSSSLKKPTLLDFLNYCKRELTSGEHIICFNVEGVGVDQEKLNYEAKIFGISWDGSDAVTIILKDLTQQETLIALKLADENKDKVLATISHELRTPINGMLGAVNIIEKEYKDPKLLTYCKTAKVCSQLLLHLVNSVLDLSQIRQNCIKLNPTMFKLRDMLEEIESIFRPQFAIKKLDFIIDIDAMLPAKIVTDRGRLIQIIVNLLANALKFTYKGQVTLKVYRTQIQDELEFIVQDTGIGIREKDKPKLFRMFGRLERADSKASSQGVGLGLTISNNLVKLLNPDKEDPHIDLLSNNGEGTTLSFTVSTKLVDEYDFILENDDDDDGSEASPKNIKIRLDNSAGYSQYMSEFGEEAGNKQNVISYLPCDLPSLGKELRFKDIDRFPKEVNNSLLPTSNEGKGLLDVTQTMLCDQKSPISPKPFTFSTKDHVLIVDDNPFNLMIVSKILEKWRFIIVTALNGEEAILRAKEQEHSSFFKMILMDCQMPVMDGYQATIELKKMMENGEIPQTPIVALTANDTKQDQEDCFKVGMSAHLAKPLKEEELQKVIDKFVKL